jgi:arylsulfatase A-like enzyme
MSESVTQIQDTTEREAAFLITSDHGEQLDNGDPSRRFDHITPALTEELLHVPLEVINPPGDLLAKQTSYSPISTSANS